ncbi:restriction endonuclease [Nocardioides sp. InS609-2]|uniref:restriction endonuclease n=1 Tax=Nocardioides sp. InS609-2 TaxID=2760705 RepID=UPI0020C15BD1|nr:restriction endonuclease [Nocardioides sp. InS609-2]
MSDHEVEIPSAFSFAWDTVQVLRDLGGSGSIEEMNEAVVQLRGLSEEQQAVPHPRGNRSEIEYRLAWARTLVKDLGLITNSQRGVWALTPAGQTATKADVDQLKKERSRRRAAERKKAKQAAVDAGLEAGDVTEVVEPDDDEEVEETDWQTELLDVLKAMDPYAFERLTKRLLREAGFVNVTVTGGSGDQGIDGTGVYRVSPLLSFPVYFQCKRYAGTVGSSKVRDFRGAMIGRGDKGLLITTGTYTPDAKAEATRDGAPPLDLIDGETLVELLREHGVGVTSTARTVFDVEIDREFFKGL